MWNQQELCEAIQQSQSIHSLLSHGEAFLQTQQGVTYLGNEEEIPLIIGTDLRGITIFSSKNEPMIVSSPLEGFAIPDSRLGASFVEDTTILSSVIDNQTILSLNAPRSHLIRKHVVSVGDHSQSSSLKQLSSTFENYNIIATQSLLPILFSEAQNILSHYALITKSFPLPPILIQCSQPAVGESFSMIGAQCTPQPDRNLSSYTKFSLAYKGVRCKQNILKERDITNFIRKEWKIPIEENCKFTVTSKYDTVYFSNNYRVYITAKWSNPKSLLSAPLLDFFPSINFEINVTSKYSIQSVQYRELHYLKGLIFSNVSSLAQLSSTENEEVMLCEDVTESDGISKCLEQISSASPDATFIQQDSSESRPLLDCTEIIWSFVKLYCVNDFTPFTKLLTSMVEGVIACEITPYFQPENKSYLSKLIKDCSGDKSLSKLEQDLSDPAKVIEIITEIGMLKLFADYVYKISSKCLLNLDNDINAKFLELEDHSRKFKFLHLLHTICEVGIIAESHLKLSPNEIRPFITSLYQHFIKNFEDFDITTTSRLTYHLKKRSSSNQTLHDICNRVPCSLWHLESTQQKSDFSVSFVNRELFQSINQSAEDLLNPYHIYIQQITSSISRRTA